MPDQDSDEALDPYHQFIAEAVHCGCVWGLEGPEGWALCPSDKYQGTDVMPFWSQPELAQEHCRDEWQDYKVVPISVEEFIEEWMPGMHRDVYLVGPNWNTDMEGDEHEPLDLMADFDKATREDA